MDSFSRLSLLIYFLIKNKMRIQERIFRIIDPIVEKLRTDKILFTIVCIIMLWMFLIAVGLSQVKATDIIHIKQKTKQVSYFQEVKKNFRKNDITRIKYIAYILQQNWYCKTKKQCLHIWVVWNAIIKAEGWDKTLYGTRIYHNPFHIKYCMSRWYKMWLVKKQSKFCLFKNYKSSIISWWRLWKANGYNSNSLRTARAYTWLDKPRQWLSIIKSYKKKFNYLIK